MTPPSRTHAAETLTEHVQWLRRLARSLVADGADADDLSQEAWVVALED